MSKIEERRLNAREKFLEVVEKDGYTLLDEYVNTETKVKMICPKGHDYITTPHNFKSGYRCPKCSGKCKEQASEDFYKCVKEFNYKCITKYENNSKKVKLECPQGHFWEVSPVEFKRGVRCAYCNMSAGEKEVAKVLDEHGIKYEIQKQFDGLKGDYYNLKFDFYIPEYSLVIEVQGEQHIYQIKNMTKTNTFKYDKLKKDYCLKNNLKLLELEYFAAKLGTKKAIKQVNINLNKYLKKEIEENSY